MGQGLAIGVLVSLLFSVVPLLEVRQVKPSLLLRNDVPRTGRIDWLKWGVTGAVAAALVGVAAWQAGSLSVGLMLSGGFVATALVLHAAGLALIWAVQPLRFSRSFALRQAVLHVVRPGNQTRVILLAVGLGTFFILGVRSLQANLLEDFAVQIGPTAPDMFLIDIQPGQREALSSFLDESERRRAAAADDSGAAGARRCGERPRHRPRQLRAGAWTQRPVARVHRDVSGGARSQREGDHGRVVGRDDAAAPSPRCRSKRASCATRVSTSAIR